jgi:hypothetical protein
MLFSSNAFRFVLVLAAACNAVTSAATTEEEPPVNLGNAENYVILAKTGISTVPNSVITGDIAVSPIAAEAMTGFSFAIDSGGEFSTSAQLQGTGMAFAADYASPIPTILTTSVSDMETAYTDAAGRPNADATRTNIGGGTLGGISGGATAPLTAGAYTFGSDVSIPLNIYFDGSSTDVFIIQMTGNLLQAANTNVILNGDVRAENIFWQVAGRVVVGAGASLKGILLVKTDVTFETGSSLYGRVLSQTACNLQKATMTGPPLPLVEV